MLGQEVSTYIAAQKIVQALADNDIDAATRIMGQYVNPELTEVANKSIALGADPDTIKSLMELFGGGEVIVVEDTAPPFVPSAPGGKRTPKFIAAVAAAGFGVGLLSYALRHR